MFSRILIKLIDEAIVPAVLLVSVRIASMLLLANYFGISILNQNSFFPIIVTNDSIFVKVNTYSFFVMAMFIALGAFYFLLKSRVLHESHITPSMATRLFSLRLQKFFQNSMDVYSEGAIWTLYSYLLVGVLLINMYWSLVEVWVVALSIFLAFALTLLLIFDVEREMEIQKL